MLTSLLIFRWLILKGRHEEARKIVEKAIGRKGVPISDKFDFDDKDSSTKKENREPPDLSNETFLDLLKSCVMFPILIVNYINWAVVTVCYYGLTMNSVNLSGDIFLNSLLGVLIEAPGK